MPLDTSVRVICIRCDNDSYALAESIDMLQTSIGAVSTYQQEQLREQDGLLAIQSVIQPVLYLGARHCSKCNS